MRVVGADGCRGGWVLADRDAVEVVDRLDDVVADATVGVVGVDMPIGLPASGVGRPIVKPAGSSAGPAPAASSRRRRDRC